LGFVVVLGAHGDVLCVEIGLLGDGAQMPRSYRGRALGRRNAGAGGQGLIEYGAAFFGLAAHAEASSRLGTDGIGFFMPFCSAWRISNSTSLLTLFMASMARSRVRRSPSYSATSYSVRSSGPTFSRAELCTIEWAQV